eukprot:jgi/Mesen1/589/ME000107S10826
MKRAEKRPLDGKDSRDGQPEDKRQRGPGLNSVIVEAVKLDSLQKLCSTLEPLLRRVVGEEVERALAKLVPAAKGLPARSSPKQIRGPSAHQLRLQFRSKLALPLFTGSKVEGEGGSAIHVVLLDSASGRVVAEGPESSAKLEVDDFEAQIVRERDGKRPLLTGDVAVVLKDGVGTLGELTFTDNSSWIRSRKFRLGLKVRGAKTEAFTVKDHRGELYKKHYPPALHDEVWRLDRIGKDGAFHKRLNQAGIFSVEDFLRLVVMDPQKLRNILGSGMSNKMWEGTVEHAKTCVLNGKLHVYYADDKQNIGVIFNNIFQLMGLIADGQYMSVDLLSESEKGGGAAGMGLLSQDDSQLFFQGGFFMPPPSSSEAGPGQRDAPKVAHVGWLKLKAALRWGIFIRKRAAQRRARLEEIEDGDGDGDEAEEEQEEGQGQGQGLGLEQELQQEQE